VRADRVVADFGVKDGFTPDDNRMETGLSLRRAHRDSVYHLSWRSEMPAVLITPALPD
jgi:hypothetical protein